MDSADTLKQKDGDLSYRSIFDNMLNGFAYCRMLFEDQKPVDFIYLDVNPAFESLTGLKDVKGKKVTEVIPGIRMSDSELFEIYGRVALTGKPERFDFYLESLKQWFHISVYSPKKEHFVAIFDVITERKRNEDELRASAEFLSIISTHSDKKEDLIHSSIDFFQKLSGCEAVGIRLKEGVDYPYYETRGFGKEFLLAENYLCSHTPDGELIRDSTGNPVIECMCGNVICGRFNPALPFFTGNGSFWSNSTTKLLASTSEKDRQARTRNRCNGEGYESVALIPLRVGEERLGLLQLNDKRQNRFTPELISFWERLSGYLAVTISNCIIVEKLTENEKHLRLAAEATNFGIYSYDFSTGHAYYSQKFLEIYGQPSGSKLELDKDLVSIRLHPDDKPEFLKRMLMANDPCSSGIFEHEYRIIRTDGEIRWLKLLGRTSFTGNRPEDKPLFANGIIQDITDRKKAEEALRQAKDYAEKLISTANAMIVGLDAEGNLLVFNQAAEKITGYTMAELHGRNWFEVLVPRERYPSVWAEFSRLSEGGLPRVFENPILTKSGEERLIMWQNNQMQMNDKFAGTISFGIDITERKKAEKALENERALLKDLVTSMPAGVYRLRVKPEKTWSENGWIEKVGTNFKLEMVSDRFCEILGVTREQCESNATIVVDKVFPEDLPGFIRGNVEGLNTLRPFKWEGRILKEGKPVWVNFASIPRSLENNEVVWTGILLDISELKKLEDQLLQAQKMEAIGNLAGGVAHDFNNMLQVILGHAQMAIHEAGTDDRMLQHLNEIDKAAQKSADLTRQLLAFARKQTIKPKILNLNDTIAKMIKMLRRLIGEDIELIWMPGGDLWNIKADPSQIDQILANLAVNSRDAIRGAGNITIETSNRTASLDETSLNTDARPGDYVMITFSDDGCGMNEETLNHIFEPFFTTKIFGEGTGLGLATVYGIVRQNNGFIDVSSEPGKGTIFKIHIPRCIEEVEATTKEKSRKLRTGDETILIVEDEQDILNLAKAQLKELGYSVLSANRPEKAIDMAKKHKGDIHLLMTDVIMPEMNGRQLCDKIREFRPDMKCLYMSGYTADVIAQKNILDKGIIFIQKPFLLEEISEKLREALEK